MCKTGTAIISLNFHTDGQTKQVPLNKNYKIQNIRSET